MIRKLTAILCVTVLATALSTLAFSGKIYRWVDEKGVVHFSDRLPEGQKNQAVE